MQGGFETGSVGRLTIILGWSFAALALLSMVIHIWSKRIRGSVDGFDDILLYLSFLVSLALMSLTTWAVVIEGQGRHQSTESQSQIELVAKSLLINEILWSIVNTTLRVAAILFIRKIFSNLSTTTTILLVTSVAYLIAVLSASLAICQPIRASWDPVVTGRCGNQRVAYLCVEVTSLILDLAIIIAPLPSLMQLNTPLRTRLTLCAILSVGSVQCIDHNNSTHRGLGPSDQY
ncbi:hypothetical protein NPX13_g1727 [Xylaria arbuscula]|uniref:Rhodopsin domain-containing protein n=1 Tax=Xylaria arbuscula TaxID=114810 RepID=A0A9W8NLE9_9PEZI|nr:hypothetical protein NPX13_g1727 [Xylaria arbuscula]